MPRAVAGILLEHLHKGHTMYIVIRQQTGEQQKIGYGHSVHFFGTRKLALAWAKMRARRTGLTYWTALVREAIKKQ